MALALCWPALPTASGHTQSWASRRHSQQCPAAGVPVPLSGQALQVCTASKNSRSLGAPGLLQKYFWLETFGDTGGSGRPCLQFNLRPSALPLPLVRSANKLSIVNPVFRNTETCNPPESLIPHPSGLPLFQRKVLSKDEPGPLQVQGTCPLQRF